MPFVHVYYPKSQGEEKELQKVSEEIHKSLITYFNIPAEDYFQLFSPYDLGQFYYHSNYLLEHKAKRTDKMILISLLVLQEELSSRKQAYTKLLLMLLMSISIFLLKTFLSH
jgi:hypothetical protein